MTVVGIAGCTALLVTGFGVRDSISDIVEKQFDDLAHYQLMVSIQDESATQGKELQALLNDTSRITGYLPVAQQDVTVVPEGDAAADNPVHHRTHRYGGDERLLYIPPPEWRRLDRAGRGLGDYYREAGRAAGP